MFAKPECDNVLQPEPRSDEGCNTLSHKGSFAMKKFSLFALKKLFALFALKKLKGS